jgi:1,4-dihydroxy-2-naphthoyl-CoA hydrolase
MIHTRLKKVFNQCVAIWFKEVTLEDFKQRGVKTCAEWLGIEVIEIGADYVRASMPVDHRTRQPMGIANGGANVVLAESICSAAANYCVDQNHFRCVGLEINANHIRPAFEGSMIIASCKPLHIGQKTHVWESRLEVNGRLSCICRMTLAVIDKSSIDART